jgi:CTP synthase (UTP-ammonia lyase)
VRDDGAMIGVVGDYKASHSTHAATDQALTALDLTFEWIATDELRVRWAQVEDLAGIFVAPGSPYRDMEATLDVIRHARERGVPLVGT